MIVLARRFALASLTVQKAFELEGNADATNWLADGRSSSAISAPRGSASIAAIDPRPRPHPKPMQGQHCLSLCGTAHGNALNDKPVTTRRAQLLKSDYMV